MMIKIIDCFKKGLRSVKDYNLGSFKMIWTMRSTRWQTGQNGSRHPRNVVGLPVLIMVFGTISNGANILLMILSIEMILNKAAF